MNELIICGIVLLVGSWLFKCGKREGSRKGYHVGRRHGRRRW